MTPFLRAVSTAVSRDIRVAKWSGGRAIGVTEATGELPGSLAIDVLRAVGGLDIGDVLIEVLGDVGSASPAKPATNIRGACWARNSFGYEFMASAHPTNQVAQVGIR